MPTTGLTQWEISRFAFLPAVISSLDGLSMVVWKFAPLRNTTANTILKSPMEGSLHFHDLLHFNRKKNIRNVSIWYLLKSYLTKVYFKKNLNRSLLLKLIFSCCITKATNFQYLRQSSYRAAGALAKKIKVHKINCVC